MNYIKIYENFLNDRDQIFNDIEKLNSKSISQSLLKIVSYKKKRSKTS